jgi:hypothetical protein
MTNGILLKNNKNLTRKKSCQEIKNLTRQYYCQENLKTVSNIKPDTSGIDKSKNLTDNTPPLGGCLSGFLSGNCQ